MRTALLCLLVLACREPRAAAPPPPPTDEEIAAFAPKWQQELPRVIDTNGLHPSQCTGEAALLDENQAVTRSVRLEPAATAELIGVLNSPALYWPSGNLCTCCPVTRVRIACGARSHEIVIDHECGWLYPPGDEEKRALTPLGRRALSSFVNEWFPSRL